MSTTGRRLGSKWAELAAMWAELAGINERLSLIVSTVTGDDRSNDDDDDEDAEMRTFCRCSRLDAAVNNFC